MNDEKITAFKELVESAKGKYQEIDIFYRISLERIMCRKKRTEVRDIHAV